MLGLIGPVLRNDSYAPLNLYGLTDSRAINGLVNEDYVLYPLMLRSQVLLSSV